MRSQKIYTNELFTKQKIYPENKLMVTRWKEGKLSVSHVHMALFETKMPFCQKDALLPSLCQFANVTNCSNNVLLALHFQRKIIHHLQSSLFRLI